MNFTAKDVQALREKTGAGMMDCKKALTETDGDMDKAVDVLREKGLASAAKKAGRIAAEGVVVAYYDEAAKVASMVEVNCETDFVAKNEKFVELANKIAVTVAEKNPADVDALLAMTLSGSDETVADAVQELFLTIRENMKVRRFVRVEGDVASYIHGAGAVGVLVKFDTDVAGNAEFKDMGKNVAMQIAAMNPEYLSKDCISDDELAKMKSITIDSSLNKPDTLPKPILNSLFAKAVDGKLFSDGDLAAYEEQKNNKFLFNFLSDKAVATLVELAMASKDEIVANKIFAGAVDGRMKKQLKEVCLLEQAFVRTDLFDGNVAGYIADVAKKLGGSIKAVSFVRFEKGEGIEKRNDDFAAEVASMM